MTVPPTIRVPVGTPSRDIFASAADRFASVDELAATFGVDTADAPAIHRAEGPLQLWCWVLLTLNGIAPEYKSNGDPQPLTYYGLSLDGADRDVHDYVFWLA